MRVSTPTSASWRVPWSSNPALLSQEAIQHILSFFFFFTDFGKTEKPKIKVKCAKELSVIKKVGRRCSSAECPDKAKACLSHYLSEADKFCTCSGHSIYLKREKVCVDLNKPCEQAKSLQICHSKATCKAAGKGLYYCKCKTGYTGDGETCHKGRKKGGSVKVTQNKEKEEEEEEEEVVEEKSSGPNIGVIAPAVGVPVLLIIGVAVYYVRKKKGEDDEEEGEDY